MGTGLSFRTLLQAVLRRFLDSLFTGGLSVYAGWPERNPEVDFRARKWDAVGVRYPNLPLRTSLGRAWMVLFAWLWTGGLPLCGLADESPASAAASEAFPVVGLAIAAPGPDGLERFLTFMDDELADQGVNTLVLRVDYRFAYKSHPELRSDNPLSVAEVKRLVAVARKNGIRLIPQINLLGHQSWHGRAGKLLEVYPEFDETPGVELPEEFEWPNDDGLYCKSYCPLHPGVHEVVFALVDELVEAFEADAFHAGLDEVFYLAHPDCERCAGKDPARLFADEVTRIRDHLQERSVELWMWGDRLIDGRTTGIGMWEASENGTAPAIDWIPRDVVICDWHYERADPTAAYFALKGFRVITCPWNKAEVARAQVEMTAFLRAHGTSKTRERALGMMQTVWSPADAFLDAYYEGKGSENTVASVRCFRAMLAAMGEIKTSDNDAE